MARQDERERVGDERERVILMDPTKQWHEDGWRDVARCSKYNKDDFNYLRD